MSQVYEGLKHLYECNRNLIGQIEVLNHAITDLMEKTFHAFPTTEPPVIEGELVARDEAEDKALGIAVYPACAWPAPGSDVPTEEVAQAFAIPQPASTVVYPDSPQNTGVVTVRYE